MYDVIVLGAAAAGSSAAVYAARRKVSVRLIAGDFGGEIALTGEVENYLGFNKIRGFELAQKMKEQVEYNEVPYDLGFLATKIKKNKDGFEVTAKNINGEEKKYQTKTVIVATGAHPKHLGVPGEKEFFHKGLTYCALCDAPLFKNKVVAVVGGGNGAISSALMLAQFAAKVYIIIRKAELSGEAVLVERLKKESKIELVNNTEITKVVGEKFVTGLEGKEKGGKKKKLELQGVFLSIGWEPNSDFIDFVKKNERNEIEIDRRAATSAPGIYAAGDVTDVPYKQLILAAGMGAAAALSVIDYLNRTHNT
ncbi:MAG: FAD-dependent oxidoreductase [Patescibacteria group bacterium]